MTITAIRAVTDIEIKAAIEKLPANIVRLAAAADLKLGRLTLAEVDATLAKSRLSPMERLTLKVGLTRANLWAE